MKKETILRRVKVITADHLGHNPDELIEDDSLKDDLGADSLELIELCMKIEAEFEMAISEEAFMELTTVGRVAEYLDERLNPVGV